MDLKTINSIESEVTKRVIEKYEESIDANAERLVKFLEKEFDRGASIANYGFIKDLNINLNKFTKRFTPNTRADVFQRVKDSKRELLPDKIRLSIEEALEPKITAIETDLFNSLPRYAIQDYYETQVATKNFTRTLFSSDGITVKKDRDFVYKFKEVIGDFDENLHELIIGLMGTNYVPHKVFSKVVGGVRDGKEYVVVTKFCRGIIFGDWLKKYCYKETDIDMCTELRNILFDLVEGLYKANKMIGFVHNDLHSSNIIINEDDGHKAKIIDYGRSRIVIDYKIYFFPYKIVSIDHYKNMWWNDIFKVLINIYTFVDYNVNKQILINDIKSYATSQIVGRPKVYKKALAIFKELGIDYNPKIDPDDVGYNAETIIKIYKKIRKCEKLAENPPCIANMAYIIRDLIGFFIPDDEIDTYVINHDIFLKEELRNIDFSFDEFIKLFNNYYTRQIA